MSLQSGESDWQYKISYDRIKNYGSISQDMADSLGPNPYDFGSPVKDEEKFADRKVEREKIREYLELSDTSDPSYYNLALTGSRAAGKTSLLNLTSKIADEMNFLPVKIPLNEDLVSSDVEFFTAVIDSIMTEGTARGMYGGRGSGIYQKFRQLIDTVNLEVEVPLGFGTAYVGSKQRETIDTIAQRVLMEDLEELHNESAKNGMPTIVLLFDECDLLAENKAVLQKLRNIFTDIEGFILVLSGTERMFPDLNETFSPLPRSFVTVEVSNFDDIEYTEECMKKPLSEDQKELVQQRTVQEVHRITGGSPYEINLVCHHMFRRYDRGDTDQIELSKRVLDDVLQEIERLRQEGHHEIADKIQRMSFDELKVLISTLEFPEAKKKHFISYSCLNNIDTIKKRGLDFVRAENETTLEELKELGVVIESEEENKITFAGDQFDSLYLRYFVASMNDSHKEITFFQGDKEAHLNSIENKISKVFETSHPQVTNCISIIESPQRNMAEKEGQALNFNQYISIPFGVTEVNDRPLAASINITDLVQKQNLIDDNVIRYRGGVDWLSGGFTTGINVENNSESVLEHLEEVSTILSSTPFSIHLNDDITIQENGLELLNEGNPEEAIDCFDEANEVNPYNLQVLVYKARAYYEMGEVKKGIEILSNILEHHDFYSAQMELYLIRIEIDDGRKEAVRNLGKMAKPTEFKRRGLWEPVIQRLVEGNHINHVKEMTIGLLNGEDGSVGEITNCAILLLDAGHNEDAVEVLEELMEEEDLDDSGMSSLYYNMACAYAKMDKSEKAFNYLRSSLELDEGYRSFAADDPDFGNIREKEEFKEIIGGSS